METVSEKSIMLPDEMVELIMLKLPAKSLIRFKGVSKEWKHLISSHTFGHRWYKSSSILPRDKSSSFLVQHQFWKPDFDKYFTRLSVSHIDGRLDKSDTFRLPYISCGGGRDLDGTDLEKALTKPLIYPAGYGIYCIFIFKTRKLALWNPTIRELKVLPWSPFNSKQKKKKDQYVYGFAQVEYKEGVFSYKVGMIRYRYVYLDTIVTIELYSSSERCWRRFKDCCIFKYSQDIYNSNGWPCQGAILKGKFHFLSWYSRQDPYIVTFDMNTESFGRLEIPSFIRHDSNNCDVANSVLTKFDEDSLCLLLIHRINGDHGGETYVDVWIMKEYSIVESWTKKGTAGPITDPDYVDVLGFCNSIEGVFFQSMGDGHGLYFCCYGSEKVETFLPVSSKARQSIQIVESKEYSIVSFNGTSDQRTKRLTC